MAWRPAADTGGKIKTLRCVVLHFTGAATLAGAAAHLTREDTSYVSAHLVIAPDGHVVQMVPFNTVAYHAGASTWQGRSGVNAFSIGIELVNPGYWRPGFEYPDWPRVTMRHKHGGPLRDWYVYPDAQREAVADVLAALVAAYGALPVVGHDDVAPGRKSDPGPAWLR